MAFFLPAALAGISALSGFFGGKNKNTSEVDMTDTSNINQTTTRDGSSSSTSNQVSTQGFAPEFQGLSQDIIQQLFGRMPNAQLDPNALRIQELVERNRVNTMANQFFGANNAKSFAAGLAHSTPGLNRGMAEAFRGSGLLGVSGDFAKRQFELPMQQEQIDASQRNSLLNLFSLLPKTNTTEGSQNVTETGTQTLTGTNTNKRTGTTTSVGQQGNPWINALAGGVTGWGMGQNAGSWGNLFRTPSFNPNV
jgi:hypothetical protein